MRTVLPPSFTALIVLPCCLQPLLNAKDALLALPGTVSNLAASVKPLTDLGSQLTQLPAAVQVG